MPLNRRQIIELAYAMTQRRDALADEIRRLLTGSQETEMLTSRVVAPSRSPLELEAGQTLEDFEVLNRLGKGAFATVYLAWQKSMQRLVALKVSADRGPSFRPAEICANHSRS